MTPFLEMTPFLMEGTGERESARFLLPSEQAPPILTPPSLSSQMPVIPNAAKRNEESLYYRLFILCA